MKNKHTFIDLFSGCGGLANGKEFKFPEPYKMEKVTSFEALSDLTEESLADGSPYPTEPTCEFQRYARKDSTGVYNHDKTDRIEAEPRDGMEITFSTEHFEPTQLLSWKR